MRLDVTVLGQIKDVNVGKKCLPGFEGPTPDSSDDLRVLRVPVPALSFSKTYDRLETV